MDHLKTTFHEELSSPGGDAVRIEKGRVHIREWNWPPHEVLDGMGADVYQEAFKNWREERRETLLARVDEVLTEFDQIDRFGRLKDAYRRRAVLPFVGAGMSMPSEYLSWSSFLRRARADAGLEEAAFEELLRSGQYERAAQEVADAFDLPPSGVPVIRKSGDSRLIDCSICG